MEKKKIIVVDDNPANLNICRKTLKDMYDVFPAPSAEKMFEVMEYIFPDLILLDVEMPGIHGFEAMRMLKANDDFKEIPIIFLSAMDDAQNEMEGLDLGAVDYIHKPFVGALLKKRIETHIAVIDGKRELIDLTRSIEKLLAPGLDGSKPDTEAEEEAIKELLRKIDFLTQMGHQVRAPLSTIIDMLEIAIGSEDIYEVKNCIRNADIESRLILEILDDTLDIENASTKYLVSVNF